LNNLENQNYINSAKFSGKLIVNNGVYVYTEDKAKVGNQGFIAATSAPIGDFRLMIKEFATIGRNKNFEKAKVQCGNFDHENKVDRTSCFSGNSFSNGVFKKENTQLAFFRALKNNNIKYIVQLTNFAEQPTKGKCLCKVKADRYFADKAKKVFRLSRPNFTPSKAKVKTLSVNNKNKYGENVEIRKLKFTDEDKKTH
jgi:hypothetical protein